MSKPNFAACLNFTLESEGGFADNPHDPGAATNKGVTQATYTAYRTRCNQPYRNVRFIAPFEVNAIYLDQYWTPIGGDALPKGVDLIAFDCAVNSGVSRARGWLNQTASLYPLQRIEQIDRLRRGFWRHLSIFRYFGRGWFAREDRCLALARQMVASA